MEPSDLQQVKLDRLPDVPCMRFRQEDEPEVLLIVKGSHKNSYYVFWEDAFQTEPRGIDVMTREEILEKYKITLP